MTRTRSNDVSPELQDLAKTFFANECSPQHLRAAWEPGADRDRTRWRSMAALDFLAVGLPATHGGLGLGDEAWVGLLEEAGYAGLPEPLLESGVIVASVIRDHGTPGQRDRWLPAIASGDAMATTQFMGASHAPYGMVADVALVAVGDELHLVAADSLRADPVPSMDRSRHTAVLRPVTDASTRLPVEAHREAAVRAAAGAAVLLNGVSRRMLDMSVGYAKQRKQFGQEIGSFQAVKHMLAEVACAVETARPLGWYALARVTDDDADVVSSAAKAAANAAAALASLHSLQVHGGIGFTWEHDLHLWMKRAHALEESYGSTSYHHRLLGAAVLSSADLMVDFGPPLPPGAGQEITNDRAVS